MPHLARIALHEILAVLKQGKNGAGILLVVYRVHNARALVQTVPAGAEHAVLVNRRVVRKERPGVRKAAIVVCESKGLEIGALKSVSSLIQKMADKNRKAAIVHALSARRLAGVPAGIRLAENEIGKRVANHLHFHRAGTVEIPAVVAHREGTCGHLDANHVLPLLSDENDIGDNAHRIADGIRYVFHQLIRLPHADNTLGLVLDADVQSAALGVRVAANPFEVLVVPRFLVFDILVLVSLHHRSVQLKLYHIYLLPHFPFLRNVFVGMRHLTSDISRNPKSNIDSTSCSKVIISPPT